MPLAVEPVDVQLELIAKLRCNKLRIAVREAESAILWSRSPAGGLGTFS
jgi:hypothetical protein